MFPHNITVVVEAGPRPIYSFAFELQCLSHYDAAIGTILLCNAEPPALPPGESFNDAPWPLAYQSAK